MDTSDRQAFIFLALNFFLFQVLWFAAVWAAGAKGLDQAAWIAAAALTVLAFFSEVRKADAAVAVLAVCVGMIADNFWVYLDILKFPGHTFAPYWIGLLWFGMGLTVNHSLRFFRDRDWLGPLIVGIFGPVTYLAGERLGAVVVLSVPKLALIAVVWVGVFAGLARFARWMVGHEHAEDARAYDI